LQVNTVVAAQGLAIRTSRRLRLAHSLYTVLTPRTLIIMVSICWLGPEMEDADLVTTFATIPLVGLKVNTIITTLGLAVGTLRRLRLARSLYTVLAPRTLRIVVSICSLSRDTKDAYLIATFTTVPLIRLQVNTVVPALGLAVRTSRLASALLALLAPRTLEIAR
jgi:hypothetical protein